MLKQVGKISKELNKAEIEDLAKSDISEILENEKYDLLKTLIELKRYNIYLNMLIAELKTPAIKQAQEIGEKSFEYANAKVRITRRVSYDYSNDLIWSKLNENVIEIKNKLKKHQELLKELSSETIEIVDEETGEVVELTPPKKKEETGLTIQI